MASEESVQVVFAHILEQLSENEHVNVVKDYLDGLTNSHRISAEQKETQCKSFLRWARANKNLKVVSADVPINILPDESRGQLHDIKVFVKFGPDDAIYDKHKDIRDKIARGNCFLDVHSGPHQGTSCVTYALKKFTGGLGDDDDRDKGDNHTWKRYFIKPLDTATQVVCTRKANGEAAHLAARCINGHYVIIAGSKNVHMMIRNRDDIERYNEPRFAIAREVGEAIMDVIEAMSEEAKNRLLAFLSYTEFTGIFEILNPNHQHVEDLSYLPKAEMKFIAWTTCDLEPPVEASLCSISPHVGIEIARCLGLSTVEYEVIPVAEVNERMIKVRRGYGFEGEVLYFTDCDNTVIGLLKKKTIWYVLCRAIREKLRAAARAWAKDQGDYDAHKTKQMVKKRLWNIKSWLNLDEAATEAWVELGCHFIGWAIEKFEKREMDQHNSVEMFPVIWKKFLAETDQTDQIKVEWTEPEDSDQ